jgi:O-antigen/teichoic acid export membrane protein
VVSTGLQPAPRRGHINALRRPALALADQGFASGANFLLNVALARAMDVAVYGSFATAFVCSLFVAVIHGGALLDPIAIIGPTRKRGLDSRYVALQLRQHLRISVLLALLPVAVGLVTLLATPERALGTAFLMAGVTLPGVLALPLVRRMLLVAGSHADAACAAGVYALTLGTGFVALHRVGLVSIVTGYMLMGIASVIGSLVLLRKYDWCAIRREWHLGRLEVIEPAHWREARALVPAAMVMFAVTQIQVPATTVLLGTGAAGVYRAMQLPMIAVGQVITAVAALALPVLASAFASGDHARFEARTRLLAGGMLIVCIVAELALVVGHSQLSRVLYGEKFTDASWLMAVLGLVGVASCWGTAFGVALRAMQRSDTQLRAALLTAVIGVPAALTLTALYGIVGAATSTVFNYLLFSAVNLQQYVLARPREVMKIPRAALSPNSL